MLIRDACYNQGMNGCYDSIVKVCEISLNRKSESREHAKFFYDDFLSTKSSRGIKKAKLEAVSQKNKL